MTLRAGTVSVSVIRLDEPPSLDVLDDDERQRAGRFMFDRDRRRFVAAHTAMRTILGRHLQTDPAALRFERWRPPSGGPANAEGGKPRLVDPPTDLRFNLSHAGERALLAAAIGREVGIDIEAHRVISDPRHIAKRFFSAAEQERLREVPASEVDEVFLRIWTRKESFIKARGDGLRYPLAGFEVSTAAEGPQLLVSCEADPSNLERWTIVALPCEPGYLAALTVEGRNFEVVLDPSLS